MRRKRARAYLRRGCIFAVYQRAYLALGSFRQRLAIQNVTPQGVQAADKLDLDRVLTWPAALAAQRATKTFRLYSFSLRLLGAPARCDRMRNCWEEHR